MTQTKILASLHLRVSFHIRGFCALCALCFGMNATAEVAPESLRVATYNIRQSGCDRGTPNAWVERKADVVALIRKLAPDVFGCQEVLPDQADYLRENLAEFAFAGEHRNKDRVSGEASPVLYRKDRFAALDGGTFWLSETPDVPGSMSWGAGYPRICSWVRLKDRQTGGVFCFASTHTDNKSELARKEGLLLVLRRMRESNPPGTPLVLVGDFNCRENEEPVEAVAEQMENALYASETPPAGPWRTTNGWQWNEEDPSVEETLSLDSETRNPKIKHGGRIDYIFVSKGVMVRSIETVGDPRPGLQTYPSDHFPVVAVLELPQSAVAADFPSYRQSFEAMFATAEESAAAECAIAPLPGGAELAFGCRWDDSSPAHLAKAAMMGRAGVKGTFYVSANRTEFMESGILGKLMEGGHAIGNHTFSHPQLFELNPNAGFREIAENRVALETAVQRPVVSYVSPYGWGKNPLDPQHRPALAESVVATGHFVTQDNPGSWGDEPPDATEFMPCWRFSANDSKPSRELFETGFREMLAKARETPDIPRFGLGTHSWCDEQGNALQETLLKEHCLNPDWAQLNDWEYGAYRYEAVHGGIRKVSVDGNRATFEATRFFPAFIGDTIPLSLRFSGAEPISAKTAESDLAKGERGTWTLPHAKEAGRLHDRIERADADGLCPAFPGLRVMVEPDEETGRLNVRIENQTGRDLRCIHVAAAFPPKWTIRKARTAADALPDSGTW